jgi:hypothetical protein
LIVATASCAARYTASTSIPDQELDSLHSIEAVDADSNHHIILLKDSLSLPAP